MMATLPLPETTPGSDFAQMIEGMPAHVQQSLLGLIDLTRLSREAKTATKRRYYEAKVRKQRVKVQQQIRQLDQSLKTHARPTPFDTPPVSTTPPTPITGEQVVFADA